MEYLSTPNVWKEIGLEPPGSSSGKHYLLQTFQGLFSPGIDGAFDGLPSLPATPALGLNSGTDENQTVPEIKTGSPLPKGFSSLVVSGEEDEVLSSSPLRRAAKEAVAKEFRSMNVINSSKEEINRSSAAPKTTRKRPNTQEHSGETQATPEGSTAQAGHETTQPHRPPVPVVSYSAPLPPPYNGQLPSYAVHMGPMGHYGAMAPNQFGQMPMGMGMMAHPMYMMYCPPGTQVPHPPPAETTGKETAPAAMTSAGDKKEREKREKEALVRELKKKTREAALVRFRQKKRERKLGKLIRYDCRKKLADARPRVKGRFVRADDPLEIQVVPEVASDSEL
uniref:CCT domain-containing protein n=1 Tax=Compsopogon caeruleus TaxID=31354 RepID=A0A6T6C3Z9_9RHOD|mmetsp:Transcript_16969/g.35212  ORF Transcript_16969/g.35212 Transcript_16969/m.35212 type:complete len:337 (+) Transcript_16969:242-1252(+)|eukprot:CAMPEP_0184680582 /NCGR_PEP_ID=MMETSP0312-20130426/3459_1 /TAXON_ID=31354 /ORGANISM="Compsopogon coeruleus, Strain SAG 36.94" /LENGTH=336 /DNA_ID=CAMNT_0027130791 /DNA_START=237 /DNA_END=1247 /DNA_ORIENTATION=+